MLSNSNGYKREPILNRLHNKSNKISLKFRRNSNKHVKNSLLHPNDQHTNNTGLTSNASNNSLQHKKELNRTTSTESFTKKLAYKLREVVVGDFVSFLLYFF